MPKATPGVPYVVVPGDTLSGIANQAYGDASRYREIWNANRTTLKSDDPNLIYPGETLTIPKIPELEGQKDIDLPGKAADDFTIVVENTELVFEAATALRTMDTGSDAWTATIVYNRENAKLFRTLRPFGYNEAQVYVGGRLMITGRLYILGINIEPDEISKDLKGFSYTVDIVDSTKPNPPYEFRNVTIKQVAEALVEPFQIPVVFEGEVGGQFDRVTIDKTEKIFDFLAKLAKQRSLLVTSTNKGELLFTQANTATQPIGSITQGYPPFRTANTEFDGRKRAKAYKMTSKRRGQATKTAVSKDDNVPISRFLTITADDTTAGDIKKAADWERSKRIADSLTFTIPVTSWYGPDGNLWTENTILTVKSEELYIPDGFNFLIRSVLFRHESGGQTAELSLVPPQVYTGDVVDEPWIL
jgi:prophage tail gpP-like protein/LysM repeat protein